MKVIELRQFLDHLFGIVEQEVRDDRQERMAPDEATERRADAAAATHVLQSAFELIGVHAVHHVALAETWTQCREVLETTVEGDHAERVLEEHRRHADGGNRASPRPQSAHRPSCTAWRGEKSAIGITVAVLGWSNSRTTSGEKLFSEDCAQSM